MPEKVRLRQPVVVILGHVDSGKCVSGDTPIQLADGRILQAKDVFETFQSGPPINRPDGVTFQAKDLELLSVGTDGRATPVPATYVWKLQADRLVTVETKAGYSVRTTPEHKFLVMLASGETAYVEAEKLKLGDHLLLPTRVFVKQSSIDGIKAAILTTLSDGFLIRVSPDFVRQVRGIASGGIEELGTELGDRHFSYHLGKRYFRASVFREIVSKLKLTPTEGYDAISELKFSSAAWHGGRTTKWISLPKDENGFRALAYLVGLLYGDGLARTAYLSNTSLDLISEFRQSLEIAFNVGYGESWNRTSYIVRHRGGKSLSMFLHECFDYPLEDKTRILDVPRLISVLPDNLVAAFLQGFFDAEGFVQKGRNIGVGCESSMLMKKLPMLLQRFGCLAYFGKRSHKREIFIAGKTFVSAFNREIGFREPTKVGSARRRERFSETNRVFELTPIPGEFLREVRAGRRVVWNEHFQLTSFEAYTRLSKGVLTRLQQAVPSYVNPSLDKTLANFSMVQVTRLEMEDGNFEVYDFTVDKTHNFIANCLVIHNTSLADGLRGTGVQAREVGGITQEIGASFFPMETLKQICGPLLDKAGGELEIPGLLMIDTPGHAVFSNLRLRGGSAADIAILVVDVLKGLENQTLESIDILKQRHVPFLIALNKIDMIAGWKKGSKGPLLQLMKEQPPQWNDELEERLYNVVGGLSRLGFQSDAYYRVKDFRQQVSIVPISARAHAGIPEMLAMLIGLAQQFLKGRLEVPDAANKPARGIILEMQEEVGIGETANIILTEGTLKVGDSISLVRKDGAFKSKVKALFMPKPLDEMRDPRDKFTSVDSVYAAAGVKLVSPDLAGVVAGTSVASFKTDKQFLGLKAEMEKELSNIVVKTDNMGVIVKAGSIGGLEALLRMLEERGVPVRQADIGDISKNDIIDAQVVGDHDPYLGAILGFDSKVLPEAKDYVGTSPIFVSAIIYEVLDNYVNWAAAKRESDEKAALSGLTRPSKLKVIPGTFFRRNDPAVFGVEIVAGRLKPKVKLMSTEGVELGTVEQVQDQGKALTEAKEGDKVAISVDGPTLGRQVKENDTIYTMPRSHEARLLRTKLVGSLTMKEKEVLDEIIRIKSSADPLFGF
ncbi:MAG: translation initiation factor IF-2 [Thaumarchaeota archaeon]|nr:translation initiation factor IF-2 [Nitrososphaerota archaeon]